MGFRFRKSFKLAPGLRLNVSKTGTSISAGPRGASVNLKDDKVRANVGIPGTGLSYRTQLGKLPATGEVPESSGSAAGAFFALVSALLQLAIVVALVVGGLYFLL